MVNKQRVFIWLALITVCVFVVFAGCAETKVNNESEDSEEAYSDYTDERDGYTMDVKYLEDGKFDFTFTPKEQDFVADTNQPFQNIFDLTPITGTADPKRAFRNTAVIEYKKREGGAFIYSNNPEMLAPEDVGQAILRNYDMQGEYIFTFEHSNYSDGFFYLGYQLYNTGDTDAVVTVHNIGYQVEGEWLGQRSWSDYFNYKFVLPDDYFLSGGIVNPIYFGCDYIDYTPEVFEPVTVTIPAGEYIYILGGTTADAHNNINIGKTANKRVEKGKCSNGVVKFSVDQGSVQGTFYCYNNKEQVAANPTEQGYVVTRNDKNYGAQYKGTDYNQGLIESTIIFIVNDLTDRGKLPVKYTKEYDPNYSEKNTPYQQYSMQKRDVVGRTWQTSLNPNNVADAIGTDMMVFEYIDTEGNPIVIDNNRADGRGEPANTGNWMVQYTDNFNLVNVGEKERTFKIYKKGAMAGALFVMIRNDMGEILDARMKANPYYFDSLDSVFNGVDKSLLVQKNGYYWFKVEDGRPYIDVVNERALVCEITVGPMSMERISVDYLILGNSNGGILHWVEVDSAE